MSFLERNRCLFWEKSGKISGFLFSFIIFSTLLYFFLSFSNKLPEEWFIYNTALITLGVLTVSYIIKKILD